MTTLYKNIESSTTSPTNPSTVEGKIEPPSPTLTTLMVACGVGDGRRKDKTAKKIAYKIIIAILIVVLLSMILSPRDVEDFTIKDTTDWMVAMAKQIKASVVMF